MSSGPSSGFRAASSGQVKQKLVRLLFGPKYSRKGPQAHRKLDASIYSFVDLKKAYLNRVKEIHPDKTRKNVTIAEAEKMKRSFQELQEVWKQYEELARAMKTVGNGNEAEANFTMFGVGCSFADTEEEKELRTEIMDQACRGWFSSGLLPESTTSSHGNASIPFKIRPVSLLDDALFTDVTTMKTENVLVPSGGTSPKSKKKTLIPGLR